MNLVQHLIPSLGEIFRQRVLGGGNKVSREAVPVLIRSFLEQGSEGHESEAARDGIDPPRREVLPQLARGHRRPGVEVLTHPDICRLGLQGRAVPCATHIEPSVPVFECDLVYIEPEGTLDDAPVERNLVG